MWLKLSGIKAYASRGKTFAYDRVSGKALQNTPIKRDGHWYGDEKLVAELAELRRAVPTAGSIRATWSEYKDHSVSLKGRKAFCDLSPRTRQDYDQDIGRLLNSKLDGKDIGSLKFAAIDTDVCRALRDGWVKKHGIRQTGRIMSACSVLWSYAIEYNHARENPWRSIKQPAAPKNRERLNRPWEPFELLAMLKTAPYQGLQRVYALCFMGVRPQQTFTVTLQQFRGELRATKTNATHSLEIPQFLAHVFEGPETSIMVANTSKGVPFKSYNSILSAFNAHRTQMEKAGIISPGLTLKGLNHTSGAALAEMEATDAEMEASLAKSREMVRHYSNRANRKLLSARAAERLSKWLELSNNASTVSNTGTENGKK